MLVLLPPSETKAPGGDGPPLDVAALSWPALTPRRERLLTALDRYTGVLYEALSPANLDAGARAWAERDVVVTSALFGALRGGDRVPAYRLSAGSRLPGVGPLASLWRPALAGVLDQLAAADPEPLLDLRSGG